MQIGSRGNIKDQEVQKITVFEQVVSKYFEIIKNILPKIGSLYIENEDMQKSINILENKIQKIERDQENLHFQVRTNHISIDSKLNSILSDYSNMKLQNASIRQRAEELSNQIKEVKYIQSTTMNRLPTNRELQSLPSKHHLLTNKQPKKITFRQAKLQEQSEEESYKINKSVLRKSNNSISLQDEPQIVADKVKFRLALTRKYETQNSVRPRTDRNVSERVQSEKTISRKGTLKSKKKVAQTLKDSRISKSQKVILHRSSNEQSVQRFQEVLDEVQSFHKANQLIKSNYEQLIQDYSRMNQAQFNKIDSSIVQINKKITQLELFHVHLEKIKLTLDTKITDCTRSLENKIDQKVNRIDFRDELIDINQRFTLLHEERRRVANKEETKKAIQFLQSKLNYLAESLEAPKQPPRLHLVDLDVLALQSRQSRGSIVQRPSTKNLQRQSRRHQSNHSSSASILKRGSRTGQSLATTKREGQSLHSRFKHTSSRFNEELTQNRKASKEHVNDGKGNAENKTCRVGTPSKLNQLIRIKEQTKEILGRDKPITRKKLKREPLIFEYDN